MHLARSIILPYALFSAALYCSLLPLWEGFDELYHYAYVQHVANERSFPVIGKAMLSRELWTSLDYVPVSHYIQPYLQRPSTSFDEYFHFTPEHRSALRHEVDSMDRAWRKQPSPRATYEAMQAPVTYLLLGPVEAVLANASLTTRVLVLRLFLSFLTIGLLWIGIRRLATRLALTASMEAGCLLVIFSCQMLYAATCRIGNDALTAPWLLFFFMAAVDSIESPSVIRTLAAASIMALGLLIKSSLLVLVPLAFLAPVLLLMRRRWPVSRAAAHLVLSVVVIGALAGPWYLRNILLYRNLTATVESSTGVGPRELLAAAMAFPWWHSIAALANSSLWTGNNSFTTFSANTLNAVIAMLCAAIALYCLPAKRNLPEPIILISISLYLIGLILIALTFFHSTHGAITGPMPWYMPVLLAPVVALAFLGLSRRPRLGRWIAAVTVLLWSYVATVSWLAKLVPLYGGFEKPHARPRELFHWYLDDAAQRGSVLSNICPAPLWLIYLLLFCVLATLFAACCATLYSINAEYRGSFQKSPSSGGHADRD